MSESLSFERIVYFGDSLTDSGEFFELASQLLAFPLPSAVFGYDGQFSNGDVYADIAPDLLGVEVENFAVGGARAIGVNPLGQTLAASPLALPDPDPALVAFDSNLTAQVGRFLAESQANGGVDSGTAASIFIGLNDLNAFVPTSPLTAEAEALQLVTDIISSTLGNAGALAQAGVETIILNTLPPASFFPILQFADPVFQLLGDTVVAAFNDALITQSAALNSLGVEVEIVDFAAIAAEIQADPSTFGFLTVTEQKFFGTGGDPQFIDPDGDGPLPPEPFFLENPAVAGLDEDQFAFFDLLHPTTATHGILGGFQAASLAGETFFLGSGDDTTQTGRADDLVLAGAGEDAVDLGRGDDIGLGGLDDDLINGNRGRDLISGGSGNDTVHGGRGADAVAGGSGDDIIYGGRGGDVLIDALGSDTLLGGRGSDAFFFTEASLIGGVNGIDQDSFNGGRGNDTLYLALSAETRSLIESEIASGTDAATALIAIGITATSIENFEFVERSEAPEGLTDSQAELFAAADLWGFI